uniref:NADH-ubiquinone oxidoreductase chain 2 n=1 Tax=Venustaconcha ellipsiformis TaxID=301928 RepID=D2DW07_VENEL|nr:NADH dehydrogenase subunit 2 [Venustaconcha ellipsiformis]ACQ91037.1 NADH dehydrogenase subunit 2 [Venustaconcha ellipsiformis]
MYTLLMSTLLATSSSNMLFVWLMMELNTLSFIPIIMVTHDITETETSIKYLIPQTLGSNLFLVSSFLIYTQIQSSPLASIALLLKAGSAPIHMWFPPVMHSINLMAGFIMLTWQKVMPLSLLTNHELAYPPIIIASAMMSALWGSIAGLNQTNLMTLMSFSSINHLGWLLMGSTINLTMTMNYLSAYTLTLTPIYLFMQTHMTKTHSKFMTSLTINNHYQLILMLTLLSMAGMPPMAMFVVKLPIMIAIMTKSLTTTLMPLILSTSISLYFYLSLTLTLTTTPKIYNQQILTETPSLKVMYTLLIMPQLMWMPIMATH